MEFRADNKISQRLVNCSLEDAKDLAEVVIGSASEQYEIGIYSGKLDEYIFKDALISTKARRVNIIVEEDKCVEWIAGLDSETRKRITLHKITKPRNNHFFFSTYGGFRFEKDKAKYDAVANMYEPAAVEKLSRALAKYLVDSVSIAIDGNTHSQTNSAMQNSQS